MNKVNLQFTLPVSILREGKQYVAYTPALDLSTSGKTFAQAKKRFEEAVNIFFEEIYRSNTLESVLLELGWQKINSKWNPPIVVANESQVISLSY